MRSDGRVESSNDGGGGWGTKDYERDDVSDDKYNVGEGGREKNTKKRRGKRRWKKKKTKLQYLSMNFYWRLKFVNNYRWISSNRQ